MKRCAAFVAALLCACATEPSAPRGEAPPRALASAPTIPRPKAAPSGSADAAVRTSRSIERAALDELVAECRANGSDALVIVKDGDVVVDHAFTEARTPIQTMSITKSVLALALGTLVDAGKLRLEQRAHEWYPEWRDNEKNAITLHHLLTHASGLEDSKTSTDIYASRSFVEFSLRSKLRHAPGSHYEYSNRGANLVSGILSKAAGMRTDRYVAKVLFEPLGIKNYSWALDRAGDAQGLAGLHLLPRDLAKLGELVLGGGQWHGQRIVSEAWVRRATAELAPVQPTNKRLALMWWLVPEWSRVTVDTSIVDGWRRAGAAAEFIEKASPLVGRRFDSVGSFVRALREHFGDRRLVEWNENTWQRGAQDARFEFGPVVGSYASGTLGQYLVILPRDRLVAVRMRRAPKRSVERDDTTRTFPDFVERVQAVVK